MSSGRPETDMASNGLADGGDGDVEVAEEETTGGGRHTENKGNRSGGIDEGDLLSRAAHRIYRSGQGRTRQIGGAALPLGWRSLENGVVDVSVPTGTSDASIRLCGGIVNHTITDAQQVTELIQQLRADPNVEPGLLTTGTTGGSVTYPVLSLCINNLTNNSVPSIWAGDVNGGCTPVAMPMWQTPALQLAIMRALIEGGADINAGRRDEAAGRIEYGPADMCWPIRVAIRACNPAAFDLLMGQPGLQLRGRWVMQLPRTLPTDQPTEESEAILLSLYRQLIQRDSTLATERDSDGTNQVHVAAMTPPVWSQQFIENYIDLLVANGADITAASSGGATPLHFAAICGSHCVAASLCRRLTAADINRGRLNDPTLTALATAAIQLNSDTQRLRDDKVGEETKDESRGRIPNLQKAIRVLLEAGTDSALMPTATEHQRRCRQLVLAERATVVNELPVPEPRPATIEAQERLQKLKEHRDKRKSRQATRQAKEAPTAADLARQQRDADAKMAALIKEEEAASKKKAAPEGKGGKKKGKVGKGQPSTATSTATSTSSPPGGEDDQADSSGAADDADEDGDSLLLGSAFASRAIESQKQTTSPKHQKAAPTRPKPAAHTKRSTRSPFSPFQPPTPKRKTTDQPSADRLLLSHPSCVSTADQTPREERLPMEPAGGKLGGGRGLGLPAAAPALLPRPAPSIPRLPSAAELRESAKRRSFVLSSPSYPPPPPRPLPPAHRPPSGADDPFPPLAHEPQQLDELFASSSSADRPSCHRGPPPLVKCPGRVESVAEEGVERDAGSDVEETGADGEGTDTVQRLPSVAAAADDADTRGTGRPNRQKPSSRSSGAAAASASSLSFGPANQDPDDSEDDEEYDAQTQIAILASIHEANPAAMMMPPPSMPPSSSLSSAAAAASPGPLQDAVSRAMFPSSSSGHRPSCHRGPPPLVKCPRSPGASLTYDEHRPSSFYWPSTTFDACPSSSSYDHPTAAAAPPAVAAAAATPYQQPLGPSHDHEGNQGASAAGGGGVGDSLGVSSREAELQRKNDELARELEETKRRLAQMSIQQHQASSSSSSSAPLPQQQPSPSRSISSSPRQRPSQREMGCYDDRCSKWRRDLQQVRAENSRRREENEGIKRKNEGRKKKDKIALVELLHEPEYQCEHCKKRVEFAGSRDEVRQWADQPIT
ncbi:unnamed protein product [Vitrella brassicaformis CCMP3155]|uniref:Uncharacterized protein n=1 Tax=Vitrella brassicaformis (strain CCMP3155) TaxID=1169540 RepID=A0A0G4GD44_VITBC|nr:unnamed protein product [Vitrella brassicaformis CCMP3155]|eukprot:CEM26919.1 unnamed protein product [Vitrella brassicaformis CCMP3155]